MWSEISRLTQQNEPMTILLTTHYLEEAADELAAQLAIVDRGKVVAAGTPDELKSSCRATRCIELAVRTADGEVGRRAVEHDARPHRDGARRPPARAQASDGATAMPSLLAALHESEGTRSPALMSAFAGRDVYLRVAGRAFQEADSEQPKERCVRPVRNHWNITLRYLRAFIRQPAYGVLSRSSSRSSGCCCSGALFKSVVEIQASGRQLHRLSRAGRGRHDRHLLGGLERRWPSSTTWSVA
jgi:hypothetical protein